MAGLSITAVGPNAGCTLAVDLGLVAPSTGGAASQGVFGAIKAIRAASQGLTRPHQLLVRALLDGGHTFAQLSDTLVELPFALIQTCLAFIGTPFTLVGQSFSTVGNLFPAISGTLALVGKTFAALGGTVALIGKTVAALSRTVSLLPWPRSFQRVLGGSVHILCPTHPITVALARARVDGQPGRCQDTR